MQLPTNFASRWAVALVICLLPLAPVLAARGVVLTKDRRTVSGQLDFDKSGLRLVSGSVTQRLDLADVALLQVVPDQAPPPKEPGNGLLGTYFSTTNLSGPEIKRLDENIFFDWGHSPPVPGVPADHFSVRWTGELQVPKAGEYTFLVKCDDGVRLFIRDQAIINQWKKQPGAEHTARRQMSSKKYPFKLEFFDSTSTAQVKLYWEGPDVKRAPIPKSAFFTSYAPPVPLPTNACVPLPMESTETFLSRRGVFLYNGTRLTSFRDVKGSQVRLWNSQDAAVPLASVARVNFQDLPTEGSTRADGSRSGVLTSDRDFIDGDVRFTGERELKVSSVLFGVRSLKTDGRVAAVLWGPIRPKPSRYVLRTKDGSVLRVDEIILDRGGLIARDASLPQWRVPAGDIVELAVGNGE